MNRRQFGAAVAALGVTSVTTGAETAVHVERLQLSRNGWMPNNERLPVLLYRRAFEVNGDVAGRMEEGYGNDSAQNGPLALSGVEGPQDAWVFRRF